MTASYEVWIRQVDAEVERRAGLSIHDLEDVPLADWHEDGVSAKSAATRAIRRSGGAF